MKIFRVFVAMKGECLLKRHSDIQDVCREQSLNQFTIVGINIIATISQGGVCDSHQTIKHGDFQNFVAN